MGFGKILDLRAWIVFLFKRKMKALYFDFKLHGFIGISVFTLSLFQSAITQPLLILQDAKSNQKTSQYYKRHVSYLKLLERNICQHFPLL